jgi:hypothetical protein
MPFNHKRKIRKGEKEGGDRWALAIIERNTAAKWLKG